jgi:hypothetical protein
MHTFQQLKRDVQGVVEQAHVALETPSIGASKDPKQVRSNQVRGIGIQLCIPYAIASS